jgi:predicted DCC family thiol-disulfide oxidoreductase YuxK
VLIYFDGFCGLCDRFVSFVLRHDRRERFRFAPLQGETARVRLAHLVHPERSPTVILDDGVQLRFRSDAALAILAGLGGAWRTAAWLRVIPRPLRDLVYRLVARYRHRWFGRLESCRVPTPAERSRFLP